jgi:hypothetical protein
LEGAEAVHSYRAAAWLRQVKQVAAGISHSVGECARELRSRSFAGLYDIETIESNHELSQNDSAALDLDRLRTATVRARTRESAFLAQHIRPLSPNYSPSIAILGSDDGADRSSEVIRQPEQVETPNA